MGVTVKKGTVVPFFLGKWTMAVCFAIASLATCSVKVNDVNGRPLDKLKCIFITE